MQYVLIFLCVYIHWLNHNDFYRENMGYDIIFPLTHELRDNSKVRLFCFILLFIYVMWDEFSQATQCELVKNWKPYQRQAYYRKSDRLNKWFPRQNKIYADPQQIDSTATLAFWKMRKLRVVNRFLYCIILLKKVNCNI